MNQELEALLKAWDEFIQTPEGPEAERIYRLYHRPVLIHVQQGVLGDAWHLISARCVAVV